MRTLAGKMVNRFSATGFTGTLYLAKTASDAVTQAVEGSVVRMELPAIASCASPARKKNVLPLMMGPPPEKPN